MDNEIKKHNSEPDGYQHELTLNKDLENLLPPEVIKTEDLKILKEICECLYHKIIVGVLSCVVSFLNNKKTKDSK